MVLALGVADGSDAGCGRRAVVPPPGARSGGPVMKIHTGDASTVLPS